MKLTGQRKLILLMTFHIAWGLFLWSSISKYGLGISTDSVHLLFGSLNLAEGKGLFSFDGNFLVLWPPLYPMLLALFGSAAITYFNKLEGRFLLPLYVPFIVLLVSAWRVLFQRAGTISLPFLRRPAEIGLITGLALSATGLLRITMPVLLHSYSDGAGGENAFNTAAWHSNTVIGYWMVNPPQGDYLLFSNYPDAISFFTGMLVSTRRPGFPVPMEKKSSR